MNSPGFLKLFSKLDFQVSRQIPCSLSIEKKVPVKGFADGFPLTISKLVLNPPFKYPCFVYVTDID